jgi:hypothetical protein
MHSVLGPESRDGLEKLRVFRPFVYTLLRELRSHLPVTEGDALSCILDRSERLNEFYEQYTALVTGRLSELKSDTQESAEFKRVTTFCGLTEETHCSGFAVVGLWVAAAQSPNYVAYSHSRARSTHWSKLVEHLEGEDSPPVSSRKPGRRMGQHYRVRPYIPHNDAMQHPLLSRSCGALVALAQLLRITDCHEDNIVFFNGLPVLIDDECIFQPVRASQARLLRSSYDHPGSIFRSFLVPNYRQSSPSVQATHFGLRKGFEAGLNEEEFVAGFREAYDYFVARKRTLSNLIRQSVEENPLVRYIARSTRFYSLCKDRWGAALFFGDDAHNVLASCFNGENKLFPDLAPLVHHEIRSLMQGDTPYFLLDLRSGQLIDPVSEDIICRIEAPLPQLFDNLDVVGNGALNEATEDLRNCFRLYNQKKLAL